ncbi:MAG: NFACT family protein [Collinsella sp.]
MHQRDGRPCAQHLCAELMGRYSNLVLVQNGKIIDASSGWILRTATSGSCCRACPTPRRQARPPDFLQVSLRPSWRSLPADLPVADALNKTVAGVGPVVCREAAWRAFDGNTCWPTS